MLNDSSPERLQVWMMGMRHVCQSTTVTTSTQVQSGLMPLFSVSYMPTIVQLSLQQEWLQPIRQERTQNTWFLNPWPQNHKLKNQQMEKAQVLNNWFIQTDLAKTSFSYNLREQLKVSTLKGLQHSHSLFCNLLKCRPIKKRRQNPSLCHDSNQTLAAKHFYDTQ